MRRRDLLGGALALPFTLVAAKAFGQTRPTVSPLTTLQSGTTAVGVGSSMGVKVFSALGIFISGTFSAQVEFSGTIDGTTWRAVRVVDESNGAMTSVASTTGVFRMNPAGLSEVRCPVASWYSGSGVVVRAIGTAGVFVRREGTNVA